MKSKGQQLREYRAAAAARGITDADRARFLRYVDKGAAGGCWWWCLTYRDKDGYGNFEMAGRNHLAHRASLMIAGIEIPEGMVLDHTCRNRSCVRPDHLRIVTPSVNSRENSISPSARNRVAVACKYGHPFTPENTRIITVKNPKTRHGKPGRSYKGRLCLACYGPGGIHKVKRNRHQEGA